ncbi:hypothetical protein EES43_18150 [Streptomyces sp. ADI96-02]|uniref:serine/arginine repetitive matrix protein 2 n=1 Tax=Streptomyces sp. ADI96-02 TaxID=1522760 RepID=UPI000F5530CE|nr:serine/arginine repetitive matrix protein 2 [Streptomyces sp. ADI96-02]RPK59638.1 hypothetical protein EES43_18150 [Streptomyces sp. ADI96-02]
MTGGGRARWNDETQSWETEQPRTCTPPPPPPPAGPPVVRSAPPGPPVPPGPPAHAPDQGPYGPGGAAYPPTGPDGLPAQDGTPAGRSFRARTTPLTAGLAVVVLASGAAALWFALSGGDDGARDDARGRTSSAVADTTGEAADPAAGGDGATAPDASAPDAPPESSGPPAGFAVRDDAEGFRIAVPQEWGERTRASGGVFYRPADGTDLLQVFRVSEPGMTALDAVRAASEERSVNPGFEEVRIGAVDAAGGEAAELVYAYDSEEAGGRRQVAERVFTAADGRLYAVLVAALDADWPRQQEVLDIAVQHFDPYGDPF